MSASAPPGHEVLGALRAVVDEVLERHLAECSADLARRDVLAGVLVEEISRLIRAGGKRLRPAFCYWGNRAAGGAAPDEPHFDDPIVRAASALELLHTMALIHDDLIDEATERRGVPSSASQLAAVAAERGMPVDHRRFGRSAALLAGDLAAVLVDRLLLTSGFDAPAIARALVPYHEMRLDMAAGQVLEIRGEHGAARIDSRLIGTINAENLLVATGVLVAAGTAIGDAAAALGRAAAPPGRLEVFGGPPARPWVVVDYAHTPDALERVLAELRSIASGSITCVFGCGGDRDRGKRAAMGAAAARFAEHIVLTDDNPRSENPVGIVADIKSGIARHADLRVVHDRERAIAGAVAAAGPGDVVLVAGKGHETTQLVGKEIRPFEDRASVQRALEGDS